MYLISVSRVLFLYRNLEEHREATDWIAIYGTNPDPSQIPDDIRTRVIGSIKGIKKVRLSIVLAYMYLNWLAHFYVSCQAQAIVALAHQCLNDGINYSAAGDLPHTISADFRGSVWQAMQSIEEVYKLYIPLSVTDA